MSNVAIIIGVSEYQNTAMRLPACKADSELINKLISGVGKFTDVLYIDADFTSAQIKNKLVSFIKSIKGKDIEEVFFYFSGHGDYSGDEFYFLLSDYDENKKSQTCLTNSELDSMLRSLQPTLAVKVVDACHAGVQYIKDSGEVRDYFVKTLKGNFEKCYFMFSSQADQPSWADSELSFFTRSFVEAVANYEGDEIRYKDIVDYISDDFSAEKQTPYFVIQSDFTEIFGLITSPIKKILHQSLSCPSSKSDATDKSQFSLVALVEEKAKDYCDKNEAIEVVNHVLTEIMGHEFSGDVTKLFTLKVETIDKYNGVPKLVDIAQWLKNNKQDYFANINYKSEEYQDYETPYDRIFGTVRLGLYSEGHKKPQTVTKTRTVISGFTMTVDDLPYKCIYYNFESRYPNVDSYNLTILYLLSKTHVRFFYFFTNYFEKSWGSYSLNQNVEWRSVEAKLKDTAQIDASLKQILTEFQEWVHSTIEKQYSNTGIDGLVNAESIPEG